MYIHMYVLMYVQYTQVSEIIVLANFVDVLLECL